MCSKYFFYLIAIVAIFVAICIILGPAVNQALVMCAQKIHTAQGATNSAPVQTLLGAFGQ